VTFLQVGVDVAMTSDSASPMIKEEHQDEHQDDGDSASTANADEDRHMIVRW
jgi:hypothetical protein